MYPLGQLMEGDDNQFYAAYCSGPVGSVFYLLACQTFNGFLGCCTDQSGCNNGCTSGQLGNFSLSAYTSGSSQSFFSHIQSQQCLFSSRWYTCNESQTETNFIGCCSTNPCNSGCPTANLAPAYLSNDDSVAKFFYGLNASSIIFQIPSAIPSPSSGAAAIAVPSSVSAITSSSVSSPSAMATSTVVETASDTGTTVVVGSVVGGVAGLALIIALVILLGCRKSKQRIRQVNSSRAPSIQRSRQDETGHEIAGNGITEAPSSEVPKEPEEVPCELVPCHDHSLPIFKQRFAIVLTTLFSYTCATSSARSPEIHIHCLQQTSQ